MKYGLLTFKNTENIGDDIQSYAAIQYLPKIDYYIEREEMDSFVPPKSEKVSTIMNGWFLHNDYSWPPSPFINPLLISMHFTNRLKDELPTFLDDVGLNYMRENGPIGLRDDLLKHHFEKNGIDTFFSGCLTLTIKKFKNIKQTNNICLVDVLDEIYKKISYNKKYNPIIFTHKLDPVNNSKLSWSKRFKNVEKLLKKYQESALVITTRLHCALPCLALGTPVLLLYDKENEDHRNRLSKFLDFLNTMPVSDFLGKSGDLFLKQIPKNPDKHLDVAESLSKTCIDFIKNTKRKKPKLDKSESLFFYKKYYIYKKNRSIPLNKVQKDIVDNLKLDNTNLNIDIKDYSRELKGDKLEIKNLTKSLIDRTEDLNGVIQKLKIENQDLIDRVANLNSVVEKLDVENRVLTEKTKKLDQILSSRAYKYYKRFKSILKK